MSVCLVFNVLLSSLLNVAHLVYLQVELDFSYALRTADLVGKEFCVCHSNVLSPSYFVDKTEQDCYYMLIALGDKVADDA